MTPSLEDMIKADLEGKPAEEKKTEGSKVDVNIFSNVWNAKSPNKEVEEYAEHALNWDGKTSTGRIVRGVEGLSGDMNRAIIDVAVGVCQKLAEFFSGLGKKTP